MSTINGKVCVVNGVAVDKVFSDGKQVYGRNLLTGTSGALQTFSGSNWGSGNLNSNNISLISGQTYTARIWIQGYDVPTNLVMRAFSTSGSQLAYMVGNDIGANSSGYSTVTLTADSKWNNDDVSATLSFKQYQSATHSGQYSEIKLEKGSLVTPWTPAPEDVLKGDITAPNNLVESQSYIK